MTQAKIEPIPTEKSRFFLKFWDNIGTQGSSPDGEWWIIGYNGQTMDGFTSSDIHHKRANYGLRYKITGTHPNFTCAIKVYDSAGRELYEHEQLPVLKCRYDEGYPVPTWWVTVDLSEAKAAIERDDRTIENEFYALLGPEAVHCEPVCSPEVMVQYEEGDEKKRIYYLRHQRSITSGLRVKVFPAYGKKELGAISFNLDNKGPWVWDRITKLMREHSESLNKATKRRAEERKKKEEGDPIDGDFMVKHFFKENNVEFKFTRNPMVKGTYFCIQGQFTTMYIFVRDDKIAFTFGALTNGSRYMIAGDLADPSNIVLQRLLKVVRHFTTDVRDLLRECTGISADVF
jgi:hypothetical protein